ncbi:MAG: hypothetical protein LBJ19_02710 [Holosporaceae bacterium]|jgi:3-deoxy-D-manno-octulosonic-acid transferase|nr:hypothetical protein [Holosporaceae bacterium]
MELIDDAKIFERKDFVKSEIHWNIDDDGNSGGENCCDCCCASILFCIYNLLILLLTPFLHIYFYWRCFSGKDRLADVRNHFGIATAPRPKGKLMWIHAASIGESLSALTYINHIKKRYPKLNILLTTITVTSADIVAKEIKNIDGCVHQFFTVDHPLWLKKFLYHWQVDVAVFLESEVWPNVVTMLHGRGVPCFLLNSRLSPNSFERWKLVTPLFSRILHMFRAILAQSEIDRQRYALFSPKNTFRIDNLKHANELLSCREDLLRFFQMKCKNKKVLVAASTHETEEEAIVEAHRKLKQRGIDLVTIIIPRHIVRAGAIGDLLRRHGVNYMMRSDISDEQIADAIQTDALDTSQTEDPYVREIYCIDAFGEVGTFLRLADVCFVGGSLVPVGGHNIFEPATFGKPVLHGPFMDNAMEVRNLLRDNGVAFEVHSSDEICDRCLQLLMDQNMLDEISSRALSITRNESLTQIEKAMQLDEYFAG